LHAEPGFAATEGWKRYSCSTNKATATGTGMYYVFPWSICF